VKRDRIKRGEENMDRRESHLKTLLENACLGVVIFDEKGKLVFSNRAFSKMTGYEESEIRKKPQILGVLEQTRKKPPKVIPAGFTILHRRGFPVYLLAYPAMVKVRGRNIATAFFLVNISDREKKEKRLKAAVEEKELLLKEVHHRVKNDIQIISSLLRLQAGFIQDDGLAKILNSSQSRIRSISLIHERLYQGADLAAIDFGDYIRALAGQLYYLAGIDPSSVRLEVEATEVRLETKKAVPCGLIINELVLNALKYAFPQGRTGMIRIEMKSQPGGRYLLIVKDDGVGLPDSVDLQKPEKLGFQIVRDLVRQLDGKIVVDRRAGTTFRIAF
jgi:PAS domain S-box-containing protein